MDRKFFGIAGQLLRSAVLATLVSSGVGASTTARIVLSRSNARSNWSSRLRQSSFDEISVLISVLIEKSGLCNSPPRPQG